MTDSPDPASQKQAQRYQVATRDQLPVGKGMEVQVADKVIALFNVAGTYYAIDGLCPHSCGPLGKGTIHGSTVTCPWHGWQFNVTNGKHLQSSITTSQYRVCLEGETIVIELD